MFDSNKPSHSILVAHGADETRHRLKAILKAASHRRIVGVASARETIDRLRRSRFDLLVTAIDLPDIDCWRLLRMIGSGAFCARIPALVLCDTNQIPLAEPPAREYQAHLLALAELARLPDAVAVCLKGPKKPTVLVVEDHPSTAQLIKFSLQAGFEVEIALTGEAGLAAWRAQQHDMVLLDLMLPDLSGSEVLRHIIAAKTTQLVIVITARSERATHRELMLAGATAFLSKPVDCRELPAFCEQVLHYGAYLNQRAQLDRQQEHAQIINHRVQAADFLLESGRAGMAIQHLKHAKHALTTGLDEPLGDDEWTALLTKFV